MDPWNIFVSKFSADDSTLLYSTFIGGSGDEGAGAIAVNDNGLAYSTGYTSSDNFPTVNPIQPNLNGVDAIVSVLSTDGSSLLYSTYFGGSGGESGADIYPVNNDIFLTGNTSSNDFPTQNPLQASIGGQRDSFFTKLTPASNTLVYSSFPGGASDEFVNGLAVDESENIILIGRTTSLNFPTVNPIQANKKGEWDFFITGITADGGSYLFSTYLGGSRSEGYAAVGIDDSGKIHIAGSTTSSDFPVLYPANPLEEDAFVATLSSDGNILLYSALLGGDDFDRGLDMVLDDDGNKYLTGVTTSPNFPLQNPLQSNLSGSTDIFVTKMDVNNDIVFSTFLGGGNNDQGRDVTADGQQNIYVTGDTHSFDFPTVNAFQPGYAGGNGDVVVAKIDGVNYVLDFSTYLGGGPYPGNPTAVSITGFDGRSNLNSVLDLGVALLLVFLIGGIVRFRKTNHI